MHGGFEAKSVWWVLPWTLGLGCDAPSTPKPSAPVEAKAPEAKAPEAKAPEAKAPEAKAPEAKAPEAKAPEAKAPEAPKPCRVLAISYARPGGPGTALQRKEQHDVEPAASLAAWDPGGDQAPPVLVAAQLSSLATQGPGGRWAAKNAPVTFALDHEGRVSLATQTSGLSSGVELREIVYRYHCEPLVLSGEYPGREDTYVAKLRWRTADEVPLYDAMRGTPTGATLRGRPKAALRPVEYATVVVTPRPIVARKTLPLAVIPEPPATDGSGSPVSLTVEAGTTLDHYQYQGEGTCLLGRDALRFTLNCYEEDLFDFGPEPNTAADSEVWVRPGKPAAWLRVDERSLMYELKPRYD